MRQRFISFEGGEGAGKSTQVARLVERLRLADPTREVVATREPGGTPQGEALRALVVQGAADRWSALSETLILSAARVEHLDRLIRPALDRGAWVICDRFSDSTRAYQGVGGGVDVQMIDLLERSVVGDDLPGLTLVFDLPVEQGLSRARSRGEENTRFERRGSAFHERLRSAFADIVSAAPQRCARIDAAPAPDLVAAAVWAIVARHASTLR